MLHVRWGMVDWNMETQLMPQTTLTMEIFPRVIFRVIFPRVIFRETIPVTFQETIPVIIRETILTQISIAKYVLLDTICLT
jgi:hypothetical protein